MRASVSYNDEELSRWDSDPRWMARMIAFIVLAACLGFLAARWVYDLAHEVAYEHYEASYVAHDTQSAERILEKHIMGFKDPSSVRVLRGRICYWDKLYCTIQASHNQSGFYVFTTDADIEPELVNATMFTSTSDADVFARCVSKGWLDIDALNAHLADYVANNDPEED